MGFLVGARFAYCLRRAVCQLSTLRGIDVREWNGKRGDDGRYLSILSECV